MNENRMGKEERDRQTDGRLSSLGNVQIMHSTLMEKPLNPH